MAVVTLIFGALILGLLWIHWFQTRSYIAKLLNAFPGPPTPFIIGHPLHLSNKPELFDILCETHAFLGHGGLVRMRNELQQRYKNVTVQDIQTVLNLCEPCLQKRMWGKAYDFCKSMPCLIVLSSMKHIEKGNIYDFLQSWLGTGLLMSNDAKWQHRRKLLTPAFHFNILRRFVNIFQDHCEELVTKLKVECEKTKTNIIPLVTESTLAIICETAMGTKLNPHNEIQMRYKNALHKLIPQIIYRSLSPWLYIDILYYLTPYFWKERKLINILHNFTKSVIRERERNFKDEDVLNLEEMDDDLYKSKKRFAMLDLLISAKKNSNEITDEGIQEEVDTFMFEGHDTTSVAISYILLTLANHKHVQERVTAEVDEIFGDSKRPTTYDDLQAMKYMDLCVKECLRLYPSVPIITRKLNEETQLTHHLAPGGIEVYIHIQEIHLNPIYYPDPDKFDPDRFLPENCKGRHPYAYIPFSAGPRNCIGQKFAMLELKSIVTAILRNFKLEPIDTPSDLTWVMDLVLRTKGAINVKFIARK